MPYISLNVNTNSVISRDKSFNHPIPSISVCQKLIHGQTHRQRETRRRTHTCANTDIIYLGINLICVHTVSLAMPLSVRINTHSVYNTMSFYHPALDSGQSDLGDKSSCEIWILYGNTVNLYHYGMGAFSSRLKPLVCHTTRMLTPGNGSPEMGADK